MYSRTWPGIFSEMLRCDGTMTTSHSQTLHLSWKCITMGSGSKCSALASSSMESSGTRCGIRLSKSGGPSGSGWNAGLWNYMILKTFASSGARTLASLTSLRQERSPNLSHTASSLSATRISRSGSRKISTRTNFSSWSGALVATLQRLWSSLTNSCTQRHNVRATVSE